MRRRNALSIAIAAVLGALAIAAIPALAGARDDHHRGGHDHAGEDHHHHGHHGFREHHRNAGKISAFDAGSGELTIDRFRGGSISGLVTASTEIRCEGRDDNSARFSRGHGDSSGPSSGSGDDNDGRGELEPGDDHGEGFEPGDDHGGRGEEEPGDDHGGGSGPDSANSGPGRGDDNGHRMCTTADLTVGTVIHEADRGFENGVATFDEIELAHSH